MAPSSQTPIVFYDGDCGLCDRSVRWIIAHDVNSLFRFAPLQGQTYQQLDQASKPTDISSVVLLEGGAIHTQSDASLRILKNLGGVYAPLATIAGIVPRSLRDLVYRFIARNRKRWFGGSEACKLPTAAEHDRLLP